MLKFIIIHGKKAVDGVNKEGQMTFLTTEKVEQHIITLVTHLGEHFKDDEHLQKLKITHLIDSAVTLFTYRGDIVFLDATKHPLDPTRIERRGSLICPEKVTEKQKETLKELGIMTANYTCVSIEYDVTNQDGFLSGKTMSGHGSKVVGKYLNIIDTPQNEKVKSKY